MTPLIITCISDNNFWTFRSTMLLVMSISFWCKSSWGQDQPKQFEKSDLFKAAPPLEGTRKFIPTSNWRCGDQFLLSPGDSQTLRFPYDENAIRFTCTAQFFGVGKCQPIITCDHFELPNSTNCLVNYVQIYDGLGGEQRFCGIQGPQKISTATSILYFDLEISTMWANQMLVQRIGTGGFTCVVRCADKNELLNFIPNVLQKPKILGECQCGLPRRGVEEEKATLIGEEDEQMTGYGRGKRVANGRASGRYLWEWQAILIDDAGVPFCGGSLISNAFILTAAHCTDLMTDSSKTYYVLLNLSDLKDLRGVVWKKIVDIVIHPFYNRLKDGNYDFDVALLKIDVVDLLSPANGRWPLVNPICLLSRWDQRQFVNVTVIFTGFGATSIDTDISFHLLEGRGQTIANQVCLDKGKIGVTSRMMCFVSTIEYPQQPCQGDSGGPVVISSENWKGHLRYVQVGVTSSGPKVCPAPTGMALVSSRLTELNDWIRVAAFNSVWCNEFL